jgi:hypothetical protein
MKYRLFLIALLTACNSVTVVPIDDEDAGDGGADASAPPNDAASDTSDGG